MIPRSKAGHSGWFRPMADMMSMNVCVNEIKSNSLLQTIRLLLTLFILFTSNCRASCIVDGERCAAYKAPAI